MMTQAKHGEHNLVIYHNHTESTEINPRHFKPRPENKN